MSLSFDKSFPVGDFGQLTLSEHQGVASLKFSADKDAGGGNLRGFLKGKVSAEIDLEATVLVDAVFGMAEAKWPGMKTILEGARKMVNAQLEADAAAVAAKVAEFDAANAAPATEAPVVG